MCQVECMSLYFYVQKDNYVKISFFQFELFKACQSEREKTV